MNTFWKSVPWGWAVIGALLAEVALIAAAFAWVAIYSYLLQPGQSSAVYQEYAQTASPYVSLLLGIPVFYLVCRWIGSRRPAQAMAAAIGIFLLYCLIEAPILLAAGDSALTWFAAIGFPTKLLGCYWGGATARPRAEAAAA